MMDPLIPKRTAASGPEAKVQQKVIDFLRAREWFVKRVVGNMYQSGLPDLFACHSKYGHRWVEIKLPGMKGSKFTSAQLDTFPKLGTNGSGVWVLTAATEDEYNKLWHAPNWYQYLPVMK